jgi:hypothetical protein
MCVEGTLTTGIWGWHRTDQGDYTMGGWVYSCIGRLIVECDGGEKVVGF